MNESIIQTPKNPIVARIQTWKLLNHTPSLVTYV